MLMARGLESLLVGLEPHPLHVLRAASPVLMRPGVSPCVGSLLQGQCRPRGTGVLKSAEAFLATAVLCGTVDR